MKVLHDTVLIKLVEKEVEEVKTNKLIASVADEDDIKYDNAFVVEIGEGIYQNGILVPMTVEQGQEVIVSKFAGMEIDIKGKPYKVVRESEILVIL